MNWCIRCRFSIWDSSQSSSVRWAAGIGQLMLLNMSATIFVHANIGQIKMHSDWEIQSSWILPPNRLCKFVFSCGRPSSTSSLRLCRLYELRFGKRRTCGVFLRSGKSRKVNGTLKEMGIKYYLITKSLFWRKWLWYHQEQLVCVGSDSVAHGGSL